jgi:3-isopropylmalate/(R)-2-methylmalate dehydratase small subunit
VNGITAVIAESFARIFRQNMFNCGMAAIELPKEKIDAIMEYAQYPGSEIALDLDTKTITVKGGGKEDLFCFDISPFDKALVLAGGWVDYADQRY